MYKKSEPPCVSGRVLTDRLLNPTKLTKLLTVLLEAAFRAVVLSGLVKTANEPTRSRRMVPTFSLTPYIYAHNIYKSAAT